MRSASAARFCTWRVRTESILPPLMRLSGHSPNQEANAALRAECFACHWPGQILALFPEQPQSADLALPLFQGRTAIEPEPRVYVCRDIYCEAPVHSTDALRSLLRRPQVT